MFTVCVVVNGAAASFPEVMEETSEWVTAIGGDRQPAHTLIIMWKELIEWSVVHMIYIHIYTVYMCVCVSRGLCGVLAFGEGGGAARGGGGGLSEGAAGGAAGAAGESV